MCHHVWRNVGWQGAHGRQLLCRHRLGQGVCCMGHWRDGWCRVRHCLHRGYCVGGQRCWCCWHLLGRHCLRWWRRQVLLCHHRLRWHLLAGLRRHDNGRNGLHRSIRRTNRWPVDDVLARNGLLSWWSGVCLDRLDAEKWFHRPVRFRGVAGIGLHACLHWQSLR